MNKIVVNFTECDITPPRGYQVKWRVEGSGSPYTNAGNFFVSPAVFYDDLNPAGTCYEGFVRSDCITSVGNMTAWLSCESGESGGGDGGGGVGYLFTGCGRAFGTEVNGASEACTDAVINNRPFWSTCEHIAIDCIIYTGHNLNVPLTGFNKMFIDGANWDIDFNSGVITGLSSVQC